MEADVTGAARIAAERQRQIEKEGWTPDHDLQHRNGELVQVAACYMVNKSDSGRLMGISQTGAGRCITESADVFRPMFPLAWDVSWDKREKHGRLRSLEIAGALIAAEIDRLQG